MDYLIDYYLMYCCYYYCYFDMTMYFVLIVVHQSFGNYYSLLGHDVGFDF